MNQLPRNQVLAKAQTLRSILQFENGTTRDGAWQLANAQLSALLLAG